LTAWGWCFSKSNSSTTSSTEKTTTISPILELAVGTLSLEGTSQAVDKQLAAQLLPYWQLLDELNASGSTAPQEVTAVVQNIQSIMTAGQVKVIQEMQLTQNDLAAAVQDDGAAADITTTKITNVAQVTTGGGPGGGLPDGGVPLDFGGSGTGFANGISSQQGASSSQSTSSATTTALIEEVIKLLEKRIKS
jgi:hypothetical protein